jgi:hypothetical protein
VDSDNGFSNASPHLIQVHLLQQTAVFPPTKWFASEMCDLFEAVTVSAEAMYSA